MAAPLDLSTVSTERLVQEAARRVLVRRWAADPLAFGREVLSHHFTRPSARMHQEIVTLLTGVGECRASTSISLPYPPLPPPQQIQHIDESSNPL